MPKSIKQRQRRRQAVLSALWSSCGLLLSAGAMLWLRHVFCPQGVLSFLLLGFAAGDILLWIPLAVSLRSRLKEIQGGEEDEASQY